MCRGMSFQELYDKANQLVTAQKIRFMYSSLTDVIRSHMLIVHHRLKVCVCVCPLCFVGYFLHTALHNRVCGLRQSDGADVHALASKYLLLAMCVLSHLPCTRTCTQSVEVNAILAAVLQAYKSHTSAMQRTRDLLLMMDSKRDSTRQSVLDLGFRLFIEHVLQVRPC